MDLDPDKRHQLCTELYTLVKGKAKEVKEMVKLIKIGLLSSSPCLYLRPRRKTLNDTVFENIISSSF